MQATGVGNGVYRELATMQLLRQSERSNTESGEKKDSDI